MGSWGLRSNLGLCWSCPGLAASLGSGAHTAGSRLHPVVSFSFHLYRNGGVGPVIWSLPIAKLGLWSISVRNTFVLIFPFLCLPTQGKKVMWGTAWVETLLDLSAPGFSRLTNESFPACWVRVDHSCSLLPSQVPFPFPHSRRKKPSCWGWRMLVEEHGDCWQQLCLCGKEFQNILGRD